MLILIGGITLYKTFALYEEKKEFNVLQGRIPDFTNNVSGDLKMALYVDGEEANNFPVKKFYNVNVQCDNEAIGVWNVSTWNVTISNLKYKNTVCNFNFNKKNIIIKIRSADSSDENARIFIETYEGSNLLEQKNVFYMDATTKTFTDYYGIVQVYYKSPYWTVITNESTELNGSILNAGYSYNWKYNTAASLNFILK